MTSNEAVVRRRQRGELRADEGRADEGRLAGGRRAGGEAAAVDAGFAHARAAFLWACSMDVAVRKPGNVSVASAGHDMSARQFLHSARVSAGPLFDARLSPGARLEAAARATREAVGCNTNLGILLLCAPLACAVEHQPAAGPAALRDALRAVLRRLDRNDARAAYRAIAIASPGGLGRAEEQDVAAEPSVDLRAAMALAAHRDLIARQYAEDYAQIFGLGLDAFAGSVHAPLAQRVQAVYLAWLATWPDSHIVRKYGEAQARAVCAEAQPWRERLAREPAAADGQAFADWDDSLKARGLNPGTSADLTVCTLFVGALLAPDLLHAAPPNTAAIDWNEAC
ncbi:triphosphoribosyl-dephospho-CoA synthase [Thauera sp. WH-1]|uniref:triphosphoribosyl-dephospho-CoA synthase n=1 Tax=Thauera sp. WH-1 TaxID=3398230 RepID=UPI0039FBE2BC